MGAAESGNPIRNMDKRTARREYASDFKRGIQQYRALQKYKENLGLQGGLGGGVEGEDQKGLRAKGQKEEVEEEEEGLGLEGVDGGGGKSGTSQEQLVNVWQDGDLKVFVRKRPIFKREIDLGEFDVVTCSNDRTIVIHDARMHTDMKKQFLNHHKFQFDHIFNDRADNLSVYTVTTAPLVKIAAEGGYATCFVYGQTGSGKTFTMSSLYEQAVYELFVHLEAKAAVHNKSIPPVSVSFFEIAGDDCHDLLNCFAGVQLLSAVDGSFHPIPCVEVPVSSPEELIAMVNHGRNVRATAATGVHDASSRSHACLRIFIHLDDLDNPHIPGNSYADSYRNFNEGTLTLVDLAGSEHRIDSMYHSADRRKEGAYINASLMALKECIRARSLKSGATHQYRKSKLTMALKQSFVLPSARTAVISCVSPASKDTEHSLNTLRHACIMDGQDTSAQSGGETRFVTGGEVETVLIGEVNVTALSKKARDAKKAGDEQEAKTSNGNVFFEKERDLTDVEKERIRRQNEKRSIAQLDPKHRRLLKDSRAQLSNNGRQAFRMRRPPQGLYAYMEEQQQQYVDTQSVQSPRPTGSRINLSQKSPESNSVGSSNIKGEGKKVRSAAEKSSSGQGKRYEYGVMSESPTKERASYDELFCQVYGEDGLTNEPNRRRQLVTLMRMHGYSEDEIGSMAPPSPTDVMLQKRAARKKMPEVESTSNPPSQSVQTGSGSRRRRSVSPSSNTRVDDEEFNVPSQDLRIIGGRRLSSGQSNRATNLDEDTNEDSRGHSGRQASRGGLSGQSQNSRQSTKAREESELAAHQAVQSEAETRAARQQAARERRLRQEEEKRQALQAKITSKHGSSATASSREPNFVNNPAIQQRQDEIAKLEEMLFTCDDLSAAAIFAINKQLASHRSALQREMAGAQQTHFPTARAAYDDDNEEQDFPTAHDQPREKANALDSIVQASSQPPPSPIKVPSSNSSANRIRNVEGNGNREVGPPPLDDDTRQYVSQKQGQKLEQQRPGVNGQHPKGAKKAGTRRKPQPEWQSVIDEPVEAPAHVSEEDSKPHPGSQRSQQRLEWQSLVEEAPPILQSPHINPFFGPPKESGVLPTQPEWSEMPVKDEDKYASPARSQYQPALQRPRSESGRPSRLGDNMVGYPEDQSRRDAHQPARREPAVSGRGYPTAVLSAGFARLEIDDNPFAMPDRNLTTVPYQDFGGGSDHSSQGQSRPDMSYQRHRTSAQQSASTYQPSGIHQSGQAIDPPNNFYGNEGYSRQASLQQFRPPQQQPPQQQQQYFQNHQQSQPQTQLYHEQPIHRQVALNNMYYGRRRPVDNVGAAAAPFANDYTWES